jgi:hypothetical protein
VFFQDDPELKFDAKSDCYLFDILKIHEIVGKHTFTRDQIKNLRKVSVRTKFIGEDGYLNAKGISGLATVASGLTGVHVYIKRVTNNDPFNFLIGEFGRALSGGRHVRHFNLMEMDAPELVQWDPWSKAGARTTGIGKIVGFRYLFAELL